MKYPEKSTYTVFAGERTTRLTIYTPIEQKIRDITGTYFRHSDEDSIERIHAIESAHRFYSWLQTQGSPSSEVSGNDERFAWVFEVEGDFIGKSVFCAIEPERQIETIVAEVTKGDVNDPESDAYLICTVCIELMSWLNRQVPSVIEEKASETVSVVDEHYFICIDADGGRAMKFSKDQVTELRTQKSGEMKVESYSSDGAFVKHYIFGAAPDNDGWVEI